jgi:hypothetical protein
MGRHNSDMHTPHSKCEMSIRGLLSYLDKWAWLRQVKM